MRVVLRYCIAASTGAVADFEFETSHITSQKYVFLICFSSIVINYPDYCVIQLYREVKVEAVQEEEEEDEDDEPLKVKAVKGANAEVWIATRALLIGRLFAFVLPLLKSKSLAAKYHQLVAYVCHCMRFTPSLITHWILRQCLHQDAGDCRRRQSPGS